MTDAVASPLPVEEYVEQKHLFSILGERLQQNMPAQQVLEAVREEILATTKLPMAIDLLLAELRHVGAMGAGMRRLPHYFTPFQCYVISEAEDDRRRFDLRIALEVLASEAGYRVEGITRQGLFLFHLEVLCRNRLGYDKGLDAVAGDPSYTPAWAEWIATVRRQIGIVDLADLIYVRSSYYNEREARVARSDSSDEALPPRLFGVREGRIAWANRRKDPLLLFAALHRQLGYPAAPRPKTPEPTQALLPALARRVEQLEARLKLVEEEQRGGINLERFYVQEDADAKRTDLGGSSPSGR